MPGPRVRVRLQRVRRRKDLFLYRKLITIHRLAVARTDEVMLPGRDQHGALEPVHASTRQRVLCFVRLLILLHGRSHGRDGLGDGPGLIDRVRVLDGGDVEGRVEEARGVRDDVREAEVAVVARERPLVFGGDGVGQPAGELGEDEVRDERCDDRVAGVGDASEEGGVGEVGRGAEDGLGELGPVGVADEDEGFGGDGAGVLAAADGGEDLGEQGCLVGEGVFVAGDSGWVVTLVW